MALVFNPFTGRLDYTGAGITASGGTFTGDVTFPVTGFIMVDSDGVRWRITIDTLGSLVSTVIASSSTIGSPMGLLLSLTYAA